VSAGGGVAPSKTPPSECPLWVISGHFATTLRMSAFGGKADIIHDLAGCLLLAKSGHSSIVNSVASAIEGVLNGKSQVNSTRAVDRVLQHAERRER